MSGLPQRVRVSSSGVRLRSLSGLVVNSQNGQIHEVDEDEDQSTRIDSKRGTRTKRVKVPQPNGMLVG